MYEKEYEYVMFFPFFILVWFFCLKIKENEL